MRPVRYSTYRWLILAVYVAIFGLVCAVVAAINTETGLVLAVACAVVGAIFIPVHLARVKLLLRDYNGVFPNPDWPWPRWGFFIILDDRRPSSGRATPAAVSGPRPICPNCRTVAVAATARYCHECGAQFTAPVSPEGPPSGR